jgi:hypothetical protein
MEQRESDTPPFRITPGAFFLTASAMLAVGFGIGYRRMSVRKSSSAILKPPTQRPELLYGSQDVGAVRLEDVTEKGDVKLAAKALVLGTAAALSFFGSVVGGACYTMDVHSVCGSQLPLNRSSIYSCHCSLYLAAAATLG